MARARHFARMSNDFSKGLSHKLEQLSYSTVLYSVSFLRCLEKIYWYSEMGKPFLKKDPQIRIVCAFRYRKSANFYKMLHNSVSKSPKSPILK